MLVHTRPTCDEPMSRVVSGSGFVILCRFAFASAVAGFAFVILIDIVVCAFRTFVAQYCGVDGPRIRSNYYSLLDV